MIGLVIVSHGNLSAELVSATEHVVGKQSGFCAICIEAEDDIEERREEIRLAVADNDTGSGVIILTDMFGGTPSNLAISVMTSGQVEVIAGVNLPMLIKLAEVRAHVSLSEAAEIAAEAGRKYINIASHLLSKTS